MRGERWEVRGEREEGAHRACREKREDERVREEGEGSAPSSTQNESLIKTHLDSLISETLARNPPLRLHDRFDDIARLAV